MFEELDGYINEFEMKDYAVDYWYDEGAFIAQDIIQKFEYEDWDILVKELPQKTVAWKRRLAYCLHNPNDLKQLEVLLILIDTDDNELFEISVDSLREFKKDQDILLLNAQIIQKIQELMPKVGEPIKRIFKKFLEEQ